MIETNRVNKRCAHNGILKRMKPSIIICPESVPVIVELCPDERRAIANNILRTGLAIAPTIFELPSALYKSTKRPNSELVPKNSDAPKINSKQLTTKATVNCIFESATV